MKYSEICNSIYVKRIKPDLSTSEQKVWKILEDLTDRHGLKQEWERIGEDIHDEIFNTWVNILEMEKTNMIDPKELLKYLDNSEDYWVKKNGFFDNYRKSGALMEISFLRTAIKQEKFCNSFVREPKKGQTWAVRFSKDKSIFDLSILQVTEKTYLLGNAVSKARHLKEDVEFIEMIDKD